MKLYHGSNVSVEKPQIIVSNRALDFGAGFYATSDENQAVRWARLQALRRKTGRPTVTSYDFNEAQVSTLETLVFDSANNNWLEYVSQNRKNYYTGKRYDLVIGPVANDSTMPVISDYMSGKINQETALVLLKPQKLSDQYAFLTYRALELLTLCEVNYCD